MRYVRRLPPVLLVLQFLALLATLIAIGGFGWVVVMEHRGAVVAPNVSAMAWAILELGLIYNWLVTTHLLRHPVPTPFAAARHLAHPLPWLDAWHGQLIAALVGTTVPLATLIALVALPPTGVVLWAFPVNIVFLIAWYVTLGVTTKG